MSLKSLNDRQLDLKIKSLVTKEREVLHEILLAIKEMDIRKGFLELGFSNLYAYLTEGVGYSAASAQRRIEAARMMNEIPELSAKIQSGEISLNQIALVQKASRQVQKIRTSENGIPVKVTAQEKQELLLSITGKDHTSAQKEVAAFFDLPVIQSTVQRFQADGSVRLEFTVSKELYENIKQAQALLAHAVPDNDLITFLKYLTDKVIKQKLGSTSARSESLRKNVQPDKGASNNVSLNADFTSLTKKSVLNRDLCCQFEDPQTKKKCGSKWFSQVDPIHGKVNGGMGDPGNGQILCAAHNQMKYRKEVGIRFH